MTNETANVGARRSAWFGIIRLLIATKFIATEKAVCHQHIFGRPRSIVPPFRCQLLQGTIGTTQQNPKFKTAATKLPWRLPQQQLLLHPVHCHLERSPCLECRRLGCLGLDRLSCAWIAAIPSSTLPDFKRTKANQGNVVTLTLVWP